MATQADYDKAFLAAGEAAKVEIQNAVAQVPAAWQSMAEQMIQTYWPQIEAAIKNISVASVDAVIPPVKG